MRSLTCLVIRAINILVIIALMVTSVVVGPVQAVPVSLAQGQSGDWQYSLPDGLGSIRHLTNPQGQVTVSYRFDPFGVPLGTSGGQPYGYAGEQWDAATGLIYLRARWYNPALGRFLTRDPFPGLATLPQTQHPYVYAGNIPSTQSDLSQVVPPREV